MVIVDVICIAVVFFVVCKIEKFFFTFLEYGLCPLICLHRRSEIKEGEDVTI
jgi:hypothetical protein